MLGSPPQPAPRVPEGPARPVGCSAPRSRRGRARGRRRCRRGCARSTPWARAPRSRYTPARCGPGARRRLDARRRLPWPRGWHGTAPSPRPRWTWRGGDSAAGWRPASLPERSCRRLSATPTRSCGESRRAGVAPSGAPVGGCQPLSYGAGCPSCDVRRGVAPSPASFRPGGSGVDALPPPPSAAMRKTFRPTSMPVSRPVSGNGRTGTSAQARLAYQPSASREIVTGLGVPSSGRDQRTATRPIFDRTRKPLSSRAPLSYCS